jgi:sulfhydrogenase subunit beta (sulfur reductase)
VRTEDARIIARSDLTGWVARLLERGEVMAPVRSETGDEIFATITRPEDVLWEFENPLLPPKHALLPQTDPIARIRKENGRHRVERLPDPAERVLLNVRSCDAVGLAYLRQVHEQDLADATVVRRADTLAVISLACHEPCELGFCVCCEAGPFLDQGPDVQLTDLEDVFFAEPFTLRGRHLLDVAGDLVEPADAETTALREARESGAYHRFGEVTCHIGSAMRRVSTNRVAEELWDAMAPWCMECGGCTYACPMCYCFSVGDMVEGDDAWLRCRTWDSCQYEAFTREASGHNPRHTRKERMKRRFFHKLSAQYYVRDDRAGCVGCGRCIRVCMGTTDLPSVVEGIRRAEWHGGR